MGKTDWKAEAKALKKELQALKDAKAGPVAAPVKKAKLVSPLAPDRFPDLPLIRGVEFAAVEAGVRYQNRKDVMLIRLAPGTAMAGVFTRSTTRSACVRDCQTKIAAEVPEGAGAAIIVNSGNSNAFTGARGEQSVAAVTGSVAAALGLPVSRVFSSSTGVIGEPMPHERIVAVIDTLRDALSEDAIAHAAQAMMTTDTFPKGASATITGDGGAVQIAGIAKGSGMIAPDMATMLCFIFTDAKIPAPALQKMLSKGVAGTFNATTVDSDTSTSDTVLLFATGQAKHPKVADEGGKELGDFARALNEVLLDLALQVVRDGEGAQKLIRIDVTGATSAKSAKRIAMTIANSPLVKTAIAGEDANWGRIVMAVGKAGEPADRDKISVGVGGTWMARDGGVVPGYDETPVVAHMKGQEVDIAVDIGLGRGKATVWTCDLTHGYIDINGSYRS
jgi:glutamate N-acetyltransferase/amino-acid N-acetyltransferase